MEIETRLLTTTDINDFLECLKLQGMDLNTKNLNKLKRVFETLNNKI